MIASQALELGSKRNERQVGNKPKYTGLCSNIPGESKLISSLGCTNYLL